MLPLALPLTSTVHARWCRNIPVQLDGDEGLRTLRTTAPARTGFLPRINQRLHALRPCSNVLTVKAIHSIQAFLGTFGTL